MTEERLRVATFAALLLVLALTVFSALMNWLAFEHRKQMAERIAALATGVEAVERMTGTRTLPQQPQLGHQ